MPEWPRIAEQPANCPKCGTRMHHDTWEDSYICHKCYIAFEPEDVGRATDRDAPIFHIGESPVIH